MGPRERKGPPKVFQSRETEAQTGFLPPSPFIPPPRPDDTVPACPSIYPSSTGDGCSWLLLLVSTSAWESSGTKINQMKIISHDLPQKQCLPSLLAQFPACRRKEDP